MLEIKKLVKIYKPKKGVAVTAINNISLKFPDKGMIFLLGKSGSGKSTLLNLLGGLDRYDGGEIIIKGVSSKDFKQQHFDSYRNTYVGFIFQEYNVLDEFSVGANIALAIELQGRRAEDSEINNILKEVDLEGYGNRKPNELSGGQKQRVAIARALVKNPEIIMADEPTGALDSNTGRQIFDTLKKLSADKLVIVVSHDREFAEQYADRIIELADGNVISDVEIDTSAEENALTASATSLIYENGTVTIPKGYHLTDEDRKAINEYISATESDVQLIADKKMNTVAKFRDTDTSAIKSQDGSSFKLIKSKLPLKNAFKIGGSGLKYKKIRLVFTILLSFVAFTLFGLADTFGSYNHVKTCTNSIIDSDIRYASVKESHKHGSGINAYWSEWGYGFTKEEVKAISDSTGCNFKGVYVPEFEQMGFKNNYDYSSETLKCDYDIYSTMFHGFVEINENDMTEIGYKLLAGSLPDGSKKEMAISEYTYKTFELAGYKEFSEDSEAEAPTVKISGYGDMIGKTLYVAGEQFTVTGIIDTGFDFSRYDRLKENREISSEKDKLLNYVLLNELDKERQYSYLGLAMLGEDGVSKLTENIPNIVNMTDVYMWFSYDENGFSSNYLSRLSDFKTQDIVWLNGEKSSLGDKEIIVSVDMIPYIYSDNKSAASGENEIYTDSDSLSDGQDITDEIKEKISQGSYTMYLNSWDERNLSITESSYKIVGYIDTGSGASHYNINDVIIVNDKLYDTCVGDKGGLYNFAVSSMPAERQDIEMLVKYCYQSDSEIKYPLQSAATYELDTIDEILSVMSKIFFYIGIGFAVFAALMLSNFIATSISHKKREIGILRAIGSRSNDVFRIFFAESFIIAIINFVLSVAGTLTAVIIANTLMRERAGILVTILNFGFRQIVLLLILSLAIAAIASFIPVKRIASKKPIDAIRDR